VYRVPSGIGVYRQVLRYLKPSYLTDPGIFFNDYAGLSFLFPILPFVSNPNSLTFSMNITPRNQAICPTIVQYSKMLPYGIVFHHNIATPFSGRLHVIYDTTHNAVQPGCLGLFNRSYRYRSRRFGPEFKSLFLQRGSMSHTSWDRDAWPPEGRHC